MSEAKPLPGYRYVNCLLPSAPDGTWREFGIWLPPQMTAQEVAKLRAYVNLLAEVAYPDPPALDLRPAPMCVAGREAE